MIVNLPLWSSTCLYETIGSITNISVKNSETLKDGVIKNIMPISGGSIDQCWRLDLEDQRKFFLKTTSQQDIKRLDCEANSLQCLKAFADPDLIKVPEPLGIIELKSTAVLLLPWLNLKNGDQTKLGAGLALLHQVSSSKSPKQFGWGKDCFIGLGEQSGGWRQSWGKFFVEKRLGPQIKIAKKWGLNYKEWEESLASLIDYLDEHDPSPSIVHGDLWNGNAATCSDGKGILIDPATSWSDREVDIAMTMLFGGFNIEFYKGYESIWPLKGSAKDRIDIYNLYHLLNHANLFGGSYKNECLSILRKIDQKFN